MAAEALLTHVLELDGGREGALHGALQISFRLYTVLRFPLPRLEITQIYSLLII